MLSAAFRVLVYELGPDALAAVWCGRRLLASYSDVEGVAGGRPGFVRASPLWGAFGVLAGEVATPAGSSSESILCLATTIDPVAQTTVQVGDSVLVLSPNRSREFRATLIQHVQALGDEPAGGNNPRWTPAVSAPWTAWHDRVWRSVVAVAWVLSIFTVLATTLVVRRDGSSDVIAMAITILLVNVPLAAWLHARNALLGRVLTGATCGVQAILLVGAGRLAV